MRDATLLLAALLLLSQQAPAAAEIIQFVNQCGVPVEAAFIYTRPVAEGTPPPDECPGLRVSPTDTTL